MIESVCTYSAPLCQHPTWLASKQLLRHGDTLASTFQRLKQSSGQQGEAASAPERGVSSGSGTGAAGAAGSPTTSRHVEWFQQPELKPPADRRRHPAR